jgi:hypothetical protein
MTMDDGTTIRFECLKIAAARLDPALPPSDVVAAATVLASFVITTDSPAVPGAAILQEPA